ncbi:MAG: thioredoxin family protein [Chthonomonas sp.]|nr:thioredoxin family protein [Chthonomonas sp.]
MPLRLRSVLVALFAFMLSLAGAQLTEKTAVKWEAALGQDTLNKGEWGTIKLTATVAEGYHIYDTTEVADGPFPTQVTVTGDAVFTEKLTILGSEVSRLMEPAPKVKFDPNFQKKVGTHEGTITFTVPFRAEKSGEIVVKLNPMAQACNDGGCLRPWGPEMTVKVSVGTGAVRSDFANPPAAKVVEKAAPAGGAINETAQRFNEAKDGGIFSFFLFAFASGLIALVTPCVFPMIPVTVSFFSKSSGGSFSKQMKSAGLYCLGIIGTFTILGLGITAIAGPTGVSQLANNLWVNLFLAILFVVLSLSLFGLFELVLPSGFVNKVDKFGRGAGWMAPIFMGTTFSLTTFTCTVAFVGTVLASSAKLGPLYSIVGMVGFSTAFALPFFFFALFPSMLSKMPKSGSWLNTVKATLGFVELMAALKFFSNVDLAVQAKALTMPVFLAIWAGLALVTAAYLFGGLKLPHEERSKIGWLRRGFGVAFIVLGGYLLMGLNGKSLGELDSFLPPNPYPGMAENQGEKLVWESDLEKAKARAAAEGKLMFIDFTGVFCTNCRYVERNIFPKDAVNAELEKFVLVKLYTDRPKNEQDEKYNQLKLKMTKSAELPSYVVTQDGETPIRVSGFTKNAEAFAKFLRG